MRDQIYLSTLSIPPIHFGIDSIGLIYYNMASYQSQTPMYLEI
ncbi:hypothetical protein CRC_03288, partial [Cylindrospermopsis raciborskii CS-505]